MVRKARRRHGSLLGQSALGIAVWLLCLLAVPVLAAADQPAKWEPLDKPGTGGFIVSLTRDGDGVWIGTEDKGVLHVHPDNANPLLPGGQSFTRKDGAPENAYALAVDPKGRVWAGSLRHGVSVFNGDKWKSYDVLDGPLGERIFHIAVCPTDGDVWMATSAGLTRYSQKNDSWSYHTRAPSTQREQVSGLPSDQASALAFNAKGDLFVGTQCDGIAISRAADDYKKWTVVPGPASLPLTPTGRGLPTALINGLLVSQSGTVYAATSAGLAWSKDSGKTWQYLRGKDYAAKVKGRWGGAPRGWQEAPKAVMDNLLPEDYVTCIAEDAAGLIWLGFRQQGYAALDPKTFRVVFRGTQKTEGLPDDFVTCILPMPDFRPYIGTYGGGAVRAKKPMKAAGAKADAKVAMKKGEKTPPLPTAAKPPTAAQLQTMLKTVEALPKTNLTAAYLGEDWTTQGDWVGRYGRQAATLCAMTAPLDHEYGWDADFEIGGRLGPHRTRDDSLRHWVHWIKTDNPRCLYTPAAGYRRQSEWDDHGETYPMTFEGPDIWVSFSVPKGTYRVAFYVMNKDGHDGPNRFRDYLLDLRGPVPTFAAAQRAPIRARCRIRDFWGGVYKSWLVTGPGTYWVRMAKNDSFNTILSAVLVDRVRGESRPWDKSWLPFMETVRYEAPAVPPLAESASAELKAAHDLWQALEKAPASTRGPAVLVPYRRLAYRAALAQKADPKLLANWRWAQPLWTTQDRKDWQEAMAKAWKVREEIKRTGRIPTNAAKEK